MQELQGKSKEIKRNQKKSKEIKGTQRKAKEINRKPIEVKGNQQETKKSQEIKGNQQETPVPARGRYVTSLPSPPPPPT